MIHASDSHNIISCTVLLSISMHIITIICPSSSSSSDAKLMWIYYHGLLGMGNGAYSPATLWVSDLKH